MRHELIWRKPFAVYATGAASEDTQLPSDRADAPYAPKASVTKGTDLSSRWLVLLYEDIHYSQGAQLSES